MPWHAAGMGLVGQDWTTIDWTKIAYLQGPIMGLKPWYQGSQPAPQGPQAPPDVRFPGLALCLRNAAAGHLEI